MRKFLWALYRRKIAFLGAIVLVVIFLLAVFAPYIVPFDPAEINPTDRLQAPNARHWFGTDNFGRDIFSRVVFGARMTILSGSGVVIYSMLLGIFVGVLSGYYKGFGFIAMRLVDVIMAFPPLLLALALMAILGRGVLNVILAVGFTYLTRTARIIYGLTLKIKQEVFIEAVRAAGAKNSRIIVNHILPNLISPLIVQATFTSLFRCCRLPPWIFSAWVFPRRSQLGQT